MQDTASRTAPSSGEAGCPTTWFRRAGVPGPNGRLVDVAEQKRDCDAGEGRFPGGHRGPAPVGRGGHRGHDLRCKPGEEVVDRGPRPLHPGVGSTAGPVIS
ncbi:hypothetical protein GCM10009609_32910 [Pseudonocardia aurantiaca]